VDATASEWPTLTLKLFTTGPSPTSLKLKGLKRQARMAQSMEDAQRLQQDIRKTEAEQRRQRQDIFAVEDEIEARRDALIAALQKRLHRASPTRACSCFAGASSSVLEVQFWRHDGRHVLSQRTCGRCHVDELKKHRHVRLTCRPQRHKLPTCRQNGILAS
jgi:hypothetical protein